MFCSPFVILEIDFKDQPADLSRTIAVNSTAPTSQGCSRLIDKRIEAIERNRKSPPSSGASAFVLGIFSKLH